MFRRLIASMTRRGRQPPVTTAPHTSAAVPPLRLSGSPGSSHPVSRSASSSELSATTFDAVPMAVAFSQIDFPSVSDAAPAWSGYDPGSSSDFSGGGGDFGGGGSDGGW